MENKKIVNLFPLLLILPAILFAIFNYYFSKDFYSVVGRSLLKEGNKVEEVEPYTYEEVQMLAVSLRVKENYDETYKMVPLTCSVNVNRTVRLIYMDGEKQLGYKYINYRKPVGTLMKPTKTGYGFVEWTNEDGKVVDENTVIASEVDYYVYANWENTPPTEPQFTISYQNAPGKNEGLLPNSNGATEVITVTITSTDKEEKYPTKYSLECTGGGLCNNKNVVISGPEIKDGKAIFTIVAQKMGVGLLKATVSDTPGLENQNNSIIYVYGPDGQISSEAKYTQNEFYSDWIGKMEGCYISGFEMTVQFLGGHSNTNDNDSMKVTGKTKSGKEVVLYEWYGNMRGELHQSTLDILKEYNKNNPNDPIVDIAFYTYSPHDGCTPNATIHYSVEYTFDKNLLDE